MTFVYYEIPQEGCFIAKKCIILIIFIFIITNINTLRVGDVDLRF